MGKKELWLPWVPHNKLVLTKELLDKNPNLCLSCDFGELVIEEGVTSLNGLTIEHVPDVISLPSSLTGFWNVGRTFAYDKVEALHICFKPVQIDGEEVSPFEVFESDLKTFKFRVL